MLKKNDRLRERGDALALAISMLGLSIIAAGFMVAVAIIAVARAV